MDFRSDKWPEEIKNIDTLMTKGTPFSVEDLDVKNSEEDNEILGKQYIRKIIPNLSNMISSRFNDNILYFPGHVWYKSLINYDKVKIIEEDSDLSYAIINKNNLELLADNMKILSYALNV